MADKTDEGMTLDEAIDHAVEQADTLAEAAERAGGDVPDLEQCELEHRQLVRWLTELRDLRYRARQLASDLDTTRTQLRDLHRDVGISLDEDVHVRVEISRFNKRWQNAHQITSDAFDAPFRGFTSDIDRKASVLRDVIERIAYETAIGFFEDSGR